MELERIQSLSHEGLNQLPSKFIRPDYERPENTKAIEGVGVPVISLSQQHDFIVREISRAANEWGFFLIKDHGIPQALIKRLRYVGEEFFKITQEEKERYANDPSIGKFEGYGTKMTKNLEDKLEWVDYFFHMMYPPNKVNFDVWPKNPASYRSVTEEYNTELLRVTMKLLELLSEGLGFDKQILKTSLGGEEKIEMEMKINMYPPCPQPELALGVEPHTDMSALTLLVPNHVPGLQVWRDGDWIAVQYIEDAIFVHVGDQLEVKTCIIYFKKIKKVWT